METSQRPTKQTLSGELLGAHSTTDQVLRALVTELKLELVADMAAMQDPTPSQLASFQGQAKAYCALEDSVVDTIRRLTKR